jgi:hypothetical protein
MSNNAEAPSNLTLWIHPQRRTNPYPHIVDGECNCETCASKSRVITTVQ